MKNFLLASVVFCISVTNYACQNCSKKIDKSKKTESKKVLQKSIIKQPSPANLIDSISFIFIYNKKENVVKLPKYYIFRDSAAASEYSWLGYLQTVLFKNSTTNLKNIEADTTIILAIIQSGINVYWSDTSQRRVIINKNFCTLQNEYWFNYPLACYSYFIDINNDGYKDWIISNEENSGKGNPMFDAYVYKPKTKQFVINKAFFKGHAFFGFSNKGKYFNIATNYSASEGIEHKCILVKDSLQIVCTKETVPVKGKGFITTLTKTTGKTKKVLYHGPHYEFDDWAKKNKYYD